MTLVGGERTMFRYLRAAFFSLTAAAAAMPVSIGAAEGIPTHPQTNSPIRVQYDPQCRRNCDTGYAACLAEAQIIIDQGAPPERVGVFNRVCNNKHQECYRNCDR